MNSTILCTFFQAATNVVLATHRVLHLLSPEKKKAAAAVVNGTGECNAHTAPEESSNSQPNGVQTESVVSV